MKTFIWAEKFRPDIESVILTDSVRSTMNKIIKEKEIGNMIFSGSPGTGKTSCAKALCEELDRDYLFINGKNCGIDTLRYTIPEFASTLSLDKFGKKVVIIDEAEKMTDDFSSGFNSFIEQFHKTCSFILTTNFPDQFMKSIDSRFVKLDFDAKTRTEKIELFKKFLKRLRTILDHEKIEYDINVIKEFSLSIFPDMRKTLNELQFHVLDNKIDEGILIRKDDVFTSLLKILSEKKYKELLEFCEKEDLRFERIVEDFKRNLKIFDIKEIPILIHLMNEAQYKHNFAINKSVNLLDFLTNIMIEIKTWPQNK